MLSKTTVAAMRALASGATQSALGLGSFAFASFNAAEDGFSGLVVRPRSARG